MSLRIFPRTAYPFLSHFVVASPLPTVSLLPAIALDAPPVLADTWKAELHAARHAYVPLAAPRLNLTLIPFPPATL